MPSAANKNGNRRTKQFNDAKKARRPRGAGNPNFVKNLEANNLLGYRIGLFALIGFAKI
jgi:hypothetical protein